jgi:hypothetical protein
MSGVRAPRRKQEHLRRALNGCCFFSTLLQNVLVRLRLRLRRTVIRVHIDS